MKYLILLADAKEVFNDWVLGNEVTNDWLFTKAENVCSEITYLVIGCWVFFIAFTASLACFNVK